MYIKLLLTFLRLFVVLKIYPWLFTFDISNTAILLSTDDVRIFAQ